jgi:hypothetical protein
VRRREEERRADVLRLAVLRGLAAVPLDAFAAPPLARFAVERFAAGLRAVDDLLAAARVDLARVAVVRLAVDLRAVARFAVDLRAGFAALLEVPDDVEADPSIDHLPDITRCAASATASAMIDPSLVALETTLLAACDAVSAASRPASRIFLRAAGLAAIAAAAAVNPAASISLLIAAFASLSIVALLEPERDDDVLERELEVVEREELLRGDLAIFYLPPSRQRHFTAVRVPE